MVAKRAGSVKVALELSKKDWSIWYGMCGCRWTGVCFAICINWDPVLLGAVIVCLRDFGNLMARAGLDISADDDMTGEDDVEDASEIDTRSFVAATVPSVEDEEVLLALLCTGEVLLESTANRPYICASSASFMCEWNSTAGDSLARRLRMLSVFRYCCLAASFSGFINISSR